MDLQQQTYKKGKDAGVKAAQTDLAIGHLSDLLASEWPIKLNWPNGVA